MLSHHQVYTTEGLHANKLLYQARDNKLTIEDMAGGTFTISNGGVFGSLMGTPIINLPQTAVLGLHAIKQKPVAIDGKVEIRPMMYLALTYDHRLLDGREAVTFLVKIKEYIEDREYCPVSLVEGSAADYCCSEEDVACCLSGLRSMRAREWCRCSDVESVE